MALRLEDKKALVEEVNAVAGDSVTAVAAQYRGLTVAEMTELRKVARSSGVYMRVVKNTLARRAVKGTDFECMQDTLKGPILLAFAKDDPGAAARVIKDFAKEHAARPAGNCCLRPNSTGWRICRPSIGRERCCSAC